MTKKEGIKYLKSRKEQGHYVNIKRFKKDYKKYGNMSEIWIELAYVVKAVRVELNLGPILYKELEKEIL